MHSNEACPVTHKLAATCTAELASTVATNDALPACIGATLAMMKALACKIVPARAPRYVHTHKRSNQGLGQIIVPQLATVHGKTNLHDINVVENEPILEQRIQNKSEATMAPLLVTL